MARGLHRCSGHGGDGLRPAGRPRAIPVPGGGDNHPLLLNQMGVGRIDPKQIDVRGLTIEQALFPFNPKRLPLDVPTAVYSRPMLPRMAA